MTDQLFDYEQAGGAGRQPVTNVGRVGYNFRLAQDVLEKRKRTGAANSMWPNANMEDTSFAVLPRDICLTERQLPLRRQTDGMMVVFSSLNGMNTAGKSRREVIESLAFAGVAGGQGAKFDTRGMEPRHPEFAGIVGGLYTITNNGTDRISNGDKVYWDIPADGASSSTELGRRGSRRIVPFTRPYRPSTEGVTARALCAAIRTKTKSRDSAIDQGAKHLKWATAQITTNAVRVMLDSGLVAYSPGALDTKAVRQRNIAVWDRVPVDDRETFITRVAAGLGCNEMNSSTEAWGEEATKKMHKLLIFDTKLRQHEDGSTLPMNHAGALLRNQESTVKDLVNGLSQATHFVTDRIFCKALTPAAPGKQFDAVFGHYRS